MPELRTAKISDIDEILTLHFTYQLDHIDKDDKADGFITTAFTKEQLTTLIEQEDGVFIALKEDKIVAYAMSASWQFWSTWPIFRYMANDLPNLTYAGQQLTIHNSYQYGPVCIHKSVRGSGIFEKLFEFSLAQMSEKYPILLTFINKINPRSLAAHTQKAKLDIIQEFNFNNNHYYELACLTKRDG